MGGVARQNLPSKFPHDEWRQRARGVKMQIPKALKFIR